MVIQGSANPLLGDWSTDTIPHKHKAGIRELLLLQMFKFAGRPIPEGAGGVVSIDVPQHAEAASPDLGLALTQPVYNPLLGSTFIHKRIHPVVASSPGSSTKPGFIVAFSYYNKEFSRNLEEEDLMPDP